MSTGSAAVGGRALGASPPARTLRTQELLHRVQADLPHRRLPTVPQHVRQVLRDHPRRLPIRRLVKDRLTRQRQRLVPSLRPRVQSTRRLRALHEGLRLSLASRHIRLVRSTALIAALRYRAMHTITSHEPQGVRADLCWQGQVPRNGVRALRGTGHLPISSRGLAPANGEIKPVGNVSCYAETVWRLDRGGHPPPIKPRSEGSRRRGSCLRDNR